MYPAERYATGDDGVETLEALHTEVAKDLNELLEEGFEVMASVEYLLAPAWLVMK